jgi:hypothetical protein
MTHRTLGLISAFALIVAPLTSAYGQLIVHEWGTMTTLHAPDGQPQARMNLIELTEVLPGFVHQYEPKQPTYLPYSPFAKGRTPGRPDVTMRLETPVIYFYDPANVAADQPFNVRVQMRGGILNEFFPFARPGLAKDGVDRTKGVNTVSLDSTWSSSLAWNGVTLDASAVVPDTKDKVWTAPRAVKAAKLRIGKEGEHYLFYRGLANLDALLATQHSRSTVTLSTPRDLSWASRDETIARIWLVDVRADGTMAFTTRENLPLSKQAPAALAQLKRFSRDEFSATQPQALWRSMKAELVEAGLYTDEAEAMLQTWNASYFRKPGLRVFYTVPRAWTDHYLPLELSLPHQATRVLIGRIDLMTSQETT